MAQRHRADPAIRVVRIDHAHTVGAEVDERDNVPTGAWRPFVEADQGAALFTHGIPKDERVAQTRVLHAVVGAGRIEGSFEVGDSGTARFLRDRFGQG